MIELNTKTTTHTYPMLDSMILKIKKPKNINKDTLEIIKLLLIVFLNNGKLNHEFFKFIIIPFHRIQEDFFKRK